MSSIEDIEELRELNKFLNEKIKQIDPNKIIDNIYQSTSEEQNCIFFSLPDDRLRFDRYLRYVQRSVGKMKKVEDNTLGDDEPYITYYLNKDTTLPSIKSKINEIFKKEEKPFKIVPSFGIIYEEIKTIKKKKKIIKTKGRYKKNLPNFDLEIFFWYNNIFSN